MTQPSKIKIIALIIGISLSAVGIYQLIDQPVEKLEQVDQPQKTDLQRSYDEHHAIEDLEKPPEQTVVKTFERGDTKFTYEVGIENGIEETAPPDVLAKISEITKNDPYNTTYIEERQQLRYENANRYQIWKSDVDDNMTCDNFNILAKKYVGKALPGFYINDKYVGAMEGYIYWKAFHECIDPKYNEKMDKVFHELEEVYAVDLSEVNVYD